MLPPQAFIVPFTTKDAVLGRLHHVTRVRGRQQHLNIIPASTTSHSHRVALLTAPDQAKHTSGEMRSSPGWELALLPVSQLGLAIRD